MYTHPPHSPLWRPTPATDPPTPPRSVVSVVGVGRLLTPPPSQMGIVRATTPWGNFSRRRRPPPRPPFADGATEMRLAPLDYTGLDSCRLDELVGDPPKQDLAGDEPEGWQARTAKWRWGGQSPASGGPSTLLHKWKGSQPPPIPGGSFRRRRRAVPPRPFADGAGEVHCFRPG